MTMKLGGIHCFIAARFWSIYFRQLRLAKMVVSLDDDAGEFMHWLLSFRVGMKVVRHRLTNWSADRGCNSKLAGCRVSATATAILVVVESCLTSTTGRVTNTSNNSNDNYNSKSTVDSTSNSELNGRIKDVSPGRYAQVCLPYVIA